MKLIFSEFDTAVYNLALEEYLLINETEDILLLYINKPAVIIGCNQVVQNEVDLVFCERNNIPVIRRISGGGAVFHDSGNLNYSFILNRDVQKSSLSDEFLLPIIEVLGKINVEVTVGKRKDLWLNGNFKVSGTASHVTKSKELHHGTLLFNTDLKQLESVLAVSKKNTELKGTASVPSPVQNIKEYLTEKNIYLTIDEFKFRFGTALEHYYKIQSIRANSVDENYVIKYQDDGWNFRK